MPKTKPEESTVEVEAIKDNGREDRGGKLAETHISIKAPSTLDVYEIEITGNLCIIRGFRSVFNKTVDATAVYKRIR